MLDEGPVRELLKNVRTGDTDPIKIEVAFSPEQTVEDVHSYTKWVTDTWDKENKEVEIVDREITQAHGLSWKQPVVILWVNLIGAYITHLSDLKRRGVESIRLTTQSDTCDHSTKSSTQSRTIPGMWESATSDLKMINADAPQFSHREKMGYLRKAEEALEGMILQMQDRGYREVKIHDVQMAKRKVSNYLDAGKDVRRGDFDMTVRVMENTIRDLKGE